MKILSGISIDPLATSLLGDEILSELRDVGAVITTLAAELPSARQDGDYSARKIRDSALAWKLKQSYSDGEFDTVLVPGISTARALSGDPIMTGKFVVVMDSNDEDLLTRNVYSASFIGKVVRDSAFLVGSPESVSALLEACTGAIGKVCIHSLSQADVSSHSAARVSHGIPVAERLGLALASERFVVLAPGADFPSGNETADTVHPGPKVVRLSVNGNSTLHRTPVPQVVGPNLGPQRIFNDLPNINSSAVAYQLRLLCEDINADALIVDSFDIAKYCVNHNVLRNYSALWINRDNFQSFFSNPSLKHLEILSKVKRILVEDEMTRSRIEMIQSDLCGKVQTWNQVNIFGICNTSIGNQFSQIGESLEIRPDREIVKLLVAGHDFKFIDDIIADLKQYPDLDVQWDTWPAQQHHDESITRDLNDWANVVWCEFASRNAVWFSRNKRPNQRLIVRVHGYEVTGPWLEGIELSNVDSWVFVSESLRQTAIRVLGIPVERSIVIPNAISAADLYRPKHDGARYNLGLVGIVPTIKRADRALDLLKILRSADSRYVLHIRGRMPFEYEWLWRDRDVRDSYQSLFERIATDPDLKSSVSIESAGPDMARWYRKVGWMLSPSTRESFHLAPIEGMASGGVAMVWDRDGAGEVFPEGTIAQSTQKIAQRILNINSSKEEYHMNSMEAIKHAQKYDRSLIVPRIESVIRGSIVHSTN